MAPDAVRRTFGRTRGWVRALAFAAALPLTACAVGPNFVRPAKPVVGGYLEPAGPQATESADGVAQHFAGGMPVPGQWWRLFRAPALDGIVDDGLKHNQTVASAVSTLHQSEDALRAGYGIFFPQVGAGLDASRQRSSPANFGQNAPSSIFNLFTLSGSVSYLVDVFGGARRRVESLHAAVDFEQDTVLAAYLSMTANIVDTSIARAGYRAEIAATEALIDSAAEQVKLAEVQAEAGTVPYSTVLGLQSQLSGLRASLAPLEFRADQADHLLAVLAGHAPAEGAPPDLALGDFTLPQDLPVSLPSELVRQRPDVLAAEARLHGASAQIGVATAALFPSLTLNGNLGASSNQWRDLGEQNSRFWKADAALSVPLFQGGSAWYGRKAAIDAYEAALADYRQVVLSAFQQVADSLRALEHDAELLRAESESASAAREALELTQANYRAGLADYLAVLTATNQFQTAQVGHLSAIAQRLQDTVALFVALGGGWWNSPADSSVDGHRR
jgi:NodT family efflux transporter outer membrane factor (OMF) lipoprotein